MPSKPKAADSAKTTPKPKDAASDGAAQAKPRASEPCQVDEQGRTIIPKAFREALGLKGPRSYVTYELEGDGVRIRKVEWTTK